MPINRYVKQLKGYLPLHKVFLLFIGHAAIKIRVTRCKILNVACKLSFNISLKTFALKESFPLALVWESSRRFATLSLVSPRSDLRETSAEIPYTDDVLPPRSGNCFWLVKNLPSAINQKPLKYLKPINKNTHKCGLRKSKLTDGNLWRTSPFNKRLFFPFLLNQT